MPEPETTEGKPILQLSPRRAEIDTLISQHQESLCLLARDCGMFEAGKDETFAIASKIVLESLAGKVWGIAWEDGATRTAARNGK